MGAKIGKENDKGKGRTAKQNMSEKKRREEQANEEE